MQIRKPNASCTPEIFELVIASLYEGKTPAHVVEEQRENTAFPTLSTIHKYAMADNARKKTYADAREACADMMADQVVLHADSNVDPQRAANRMKARQFWASKLKPKVYGDKLDIDLNQRVDVSIAIQAARARAQLPSVEPLTIDNEPQEEQAVVDPFT